MSLIREIVEDSMPIWNACLNTPFLKEMAADALPDAKFQKYLMQDNRYLENYARVCGKAIYLAAGFREIQVYYDMLSFAGESECEKRKSYLRRLGFAGGLESVVPEKENRAYIRFLLDVADKENKKEILMAILPCMLSYAYIFRKMKYKGKRYADFINDYAEREYAEKCRVWSMFALRVCAGCSEEEKERLKRVFRTASLFELDFWKMAYR